MISSDGSAVSLPAWRKRDRPRIVHVIPTLRTGGLESMLLRLITDLAGEFEHIVVTPSGHGRLTRAFSTVARVMALGESRVPDRWMALRMARRFRALRPQIVHSRNWTCIDAVIGARLAGVRTVIHGEHGRDAGGPGRPERGTPPGPPCARAARHRIHDCEPEPYPMACRGRRCARAEGPLHSQRSRYRAFRATPARDGAPGARRAARCRGNRNGRPPRPGQGSCRAHAGLCCGRSRSSRRPAHRGGRTLSGANRGHRQGARRD